MCEVVCLFLAESQNFTPPESEAVSTLCPRFEKQGSIQALVGITTVIEIFGYKATFGR